MVSQSSWRAQVCPWRSKLAERSGQGHRGCKGNRCPVPGDQWAQDRDISMEVYRVASTHILHISGDKYGAVPHSTWKGRKRAVVQGEPPSWLQATSCKLSSSLLERQSMLALGTRPPKVRCFQGSLVVPPKVASRGFFWPQAGLAGCRQHFHPYFFTPGLLCPAPPPSLQPTTPPAVGMWRRRPLPLCPCPLRHLCHSPISPTPQHTHTHTHTHTCTSLALGASCAESDPHLPGVLRPASPPLLWFPSSGQTHTGFGSYSSSLVIALSSHSLLPPGYKADQIFPVPTTATTLTKTKNPSGMLISPQALVSLFFTFPFKICSELLPLHLSTQPFNYGRDCFFQASETKGHQWLTASLITLLSPLATLPAWTSRPAQPSPSQPSSTQPSSSGLFFLVYLPLLLHVPQSLAFSLSLSGLYLSNHIPV